MVSSSLSLRGEAKEKGRISSNGEGREIELVWQENEQMAKWVHLIDSRPPRQTMFFMF